MMYFTKRMELLKTFKKWIKEVRKKNSCIKANVETFIAFCVKYDLFDQKKIDLLLYAHQEGGEE